MKFLFKFFTTRVIVWNVVVLIFVKLVFSYSAFQWATLLGPSTSVNSRDIIIATNKARINYNLTVLKPSFLLEAAAVAKAQDMAIKNYFAHFSPTGVSPWFWMEKNNYRYAYAGENIAIGFINASDTVQAWLGSPSHRANLLNTKYQEIGVATAEVEIGGIKGTLIVQMFGKPAAVAAQSAPQPKATPPKTLVLPRPAFLGTADFSSTSISYREPPVKFEYISTDEEVRPVSRVVKIEIPQSTKVQDWARNLDHAHLIYAFMMASLSLVGLLFIKRDKLFWVKMTVQVSLFFLAIIFPLISVSVPGRIF